MFLDAVVSLASSVKVGTETEMLLPSTSTRKKDVRILKKKKKFVVVDELI